MRFLFLLLMAVLARADEGNLKGLTVTADTNLVSNGQVNFTALTAGSGGSILCINANRIYVGGCSGGLPGYVTTSTATVNQIPVYTTPTNIGPSSLSDNGTTVTTSEALTVTNNISGTNYYVGSTQIITNSLNLGNLVNGIFSGNLQAATATLTGLTVDTVITGVGKIITASASGATNTISTPGRYYITANLTGPAGGYLFNVTSDDVELTCYPGVVLTNGGGGIVHENKVYHGRINSCWMDENSVASSKGIFVDGSWYTHIEDTHFYAASSPASTSDLYIFSDVDCGPGGNNTYCGSFEGEYLNNSFNLVSIISDPSNTVTTQTFEQNDVVNFVIAHASTITIKGGSLTPSSPTDMFNISYVNGLTVIGVDLAETPTSYVYNCTANCNNIRSFGNLTNPTGLYKGGTGWGGPISLLDGGEQLFFGSLEPLTFQNAGWNQFSYLGYEFSGDTFEVGSNLRSVSSTTGDLADTTAAGTTLRLTPGYGLQVFSATAGTNPRTLTEMFDLNTSGDLTLNGYLSSTNGFPDIEQYGCTSGMSDATTCINAAIAANPAIRIPKGTWNVGTGGGNLTLHSNLLIVGDGPGTIIQRAGTIGATLGLFDLANLSNVRVTNLLIDGAVTTPATQDYATITDPLQANLTLNSTFWLHGGTNITLDHLAIQHTGGYAVIVDATANNVNGVRITDSVLQNNRPFLFGTGSDLTYGSWTGGIFWDSDGSSHNIQNLAITGNTFMWSTGNAVWGHAGALTLLNKNIAVSGNLFQDIGLDGIGGGPVDGYTVSANNFLRIGYPSITDNTTGTAKWYNACTGGVVSGPGGTCLSGVAASIPAVAIDSTGLVLNFTVTGNTVVAHNGGCIDLDGAGYGSVAGNQCYIPSSGDPEYSDAQPSNWGPAVGPNIATAGQNWMYGISTGNTQNTFWGAGFITITGNSLTGQSGGSVRLFSGKSNQVKDNLIYSVPDVSLIIPVVHYDPIVIGPQSTSANQQACDNEVAGNRISYIGSVGISAVDEDTQYAAFGTGCQNTVHDNTLVGNLSQFSKSPTSESIYYGAQTIVSGTSTISQYLLCNALSTSTTNACVTNQLELSSGVYLDRWYSPSADLMLTIGTDSALRIGDGSIGSLWLGGNLTLDVNRNAYLNSITDTASGTLVFDSARNFYGNSFSVGTYGSAFLAISSNGTISAAPGGSGYYLGGTQIITPAGNIGNIGNIIGSGNQQMDGNVAANSFYIWNPSGPGSSQVIAPYTAGSVACTPTAPCGNIGNVLDITALGTITAGTMSTSDLNVGSVFTMSPPTASSGSKALCMNGTQVFVSTTNVCPP